MNMTSHTHSAMDFQSFATAADTSQTARTGADMSLAVTMTIGGRARTVYPYGFLVQSGGLVVLENADADSRSTNAVAGVLYPCQGVKGKQATVLDDANTDADEITFFYTA